MSTPAADGFFMPAEWWPHSRCWMAWPCRKEVWGKQLDAVADGYAEVADAISAFEPVSILARGDEVAEVSMRTSNRVPTLALAHDGSSLRDNGPVFVIDGKGGVAGVEFGFNGWGNRYAQWQNDAAVPAALLERLELKRYVAPLILEGGAIHVDGEGTCITTEQSLLHPGRNPDKSKEEIERILSDYLGISKVIWLVGDPSDLVNDGHVDELACFTKPGVVLALHPGPLNAANHEALSENLRRLRLAEDAKGRRLEVIEMPQTQKPLPEFHGGKAHASYLNYYLANGAVILPIYEDNNDQKAIELVTAQFPGRRIVPVPCRDVGFGGNAIHGMTLGQPTGLP